MQLQNETEWQYSLVLIEAAAATKLNVVCWNVTDLPTRQHFNKTLSHCKQIIQSLFTIMRSFIKISNKTSIKHWNDSRANEAEMLHQLIRDIKGRLTQISSKTVLERTQDECAMYGKVPDHQNYNRKWAGSTRQICAQNEQIGRRRWLQRDIKGRFTQIS